LYSNVPTVDGSTTEVFSGKMLYGTVCKLIYSFIGLKSFENI